MSKMRHILKRGVNYAFEVDSNMLGVPHFATAMDNQSPSSLLWWDEVFSICFIEAAKIQIDRRVVLNFSSNK